jgi:hypothetical protein
MVSVVAIIPNRGPWPTGKLIGLLDVGPDKQITTQDVRELLTAQFPVYGFRSRTSLIPSFVITYQIAFRC